VVECLRAFDHVGFFVLGYSSETEEVLATSLDGVLVDGNLLSQCEDLRDVSQAVSVARKNRGHKEESMVRSNTFLVGSAVLLMLAWTAGSPLSWARGGSGGHSGGMGGGRSSSGGSFGGARSFSSYGAPRSDSISPNAGVGNFGNSGRLNSGTALNGEQRFSSQAYSHPWNNNSWNHNYYGRGGYGYGGFAPWGGLGWGYGGLGYGDWGYPWYGGYGGYGDYAGYYDNPGIYTEGAAPVQYSLYSDQTAATVPVGEEQADSDEEFMNRALEAFHSGQYAEAARWASHAAIENPKNAKVHELTSLALFALKDYRGANMEAHAALSLAPAADWNMLFSYYGDVNTYNQQLDALVSYIGQHTKAFDARFVLAYQDLMMGHKDAAKGELEQVAKGVSQDKLANQLLQKLGGQTPPATAEKPVEQR
jgi:hypothetical protein